MQTTSDWLPDNITTQQAMKNRRNSVLHRLPDKPVNREFVVFNL